MQVSIVLQEGMARPLEEFVVYDDRLGAAARAEHFTVTAR